MDACFRHLHYGYIVALGATPGAPGHHCGGDFIEVAASNAYVPAAPRPDGVRHYCCPEAPVCTFVSTEAAVAAHWPNCELCGVEESTREAREGERAYVERGDPLGLYGP